MKELKNQLLKNVKINFMVIFTSIVYTLSKASSCQVYGDFPLYNGHADSKNLLMYLLFILLPAICDIKHISRSSHRKVSSQVVAKVIY